MNEANKKSGKRERLSTCASAKFAAVSVVPCRRTVYEFPFSREEDARVDAVGPRQTERREHTTITAHHTPVIEIAEEMQPDEKNKNIRRE